MCKSAKQKAPSYSLEAFINPGTGLSFQAVTHQVLSLLTVFTFVFGMGTGVFRSLRHQEPFRVRCTVFDTLVIDINYGTSYPENYILRRVARYPCRSLTAYPTIYVGQALGQLVTLGYTLTLRGASTCVLSTRWSSWVLTGLSSMGFLILRWASYLYAFSTYPLQTQLPCVYRWRDNRYTGGLSVPVLSY